MFASQSSFQIVFLVIDIMTKKYSTPEEVAAAKKERQRLHRKLNIERYRLLLKQRRIKEMIRKKEEYPDKGRLSMEELQSRLVEISCELENYPLSVSYNEQTSSKGKVCSGECGANSLESEETSIQGVSEET